VTRAVPREFPAVKARIVRNAVRAGPIDFYSGIGARVDDRVGAGFQVRDPKATGEDSEIACRSERHSVGISRIMERAAAFDPGQLEDIFVRDVERKPSGIQVESVATWYASEVAEPTLTGESL
jgi:hypothetical protein